MFNDAMTNGKVPIEWKKVIVTLLHKKGSKLHLSNYRGISLQNSIGKLLEKMITIRLQRHVEENDCLPKIKKDFEHIDLV